MHLDGYDPYFTCNGRRYVEIDPTRELRILIQAELEDGENSSYPVLLTQEWTDGHDFDEPFCWASQDCDCVPFGDVGT